ncbi:ATP-binding cassette domain-containing protein [Corynebacterium sp.]|uniref:ABC transporter ATP-binding protein n=1 Tax=Corynebacterium sp. TaxID=1720 RepID=UPI0019B493B9|nr:ATP-binding cassette domain-containing protein [Corynebacterium sp.]HHU66897.1 ATP-binding cassette domain-containing protein [Corynebacterium sp.]HKM24272.1 ATP-binding cassette domain-containing protein [Corynebacterium sp.]
MIEFDRVSRTYPGSARPAVEDFSHRVASGSTTVFVGPSGCGKTTLLRMVNRMVSPDSGRVLVRGANVADLDPVRLRRSIGYVMQHSGLLPHRTVVDNVATVARLNGTPKGEARARAVEMLRLVGLDPDLGGRYPAELSGGQAQRVGVARGLVADPDILLMDEPFGAVDPVVRRGLQEEILSLQERMSKTILMVTHDIDEAFLLGDQIVLLGDRGRIEQVGPPEEFLTAPANDRVREFTGAEGRELSVEKRDGRTLVVDRNGRVRGVLT